MCLCLYTRCVLACTVIHFRYQPNPIQGGEGELEPIPAATGQKVKYTLNGMLAGTCTTQTNKEPLQLQSPENYDTMLRFLKQEFFFVINTV